MAWTLGKVRGIAIRIHWSLLLALPFFAYLMAVRYFSEGEPTGGVGGAVAIAWGGALAIVLFLSVLIHEFSHSLMAQSRGHGVESILLFPLGGVSNMERIPDRPRDEFLITVVGPLTNFVLAVPLLVLWSLDVLSGGLAIFVRWAGWLNVAVGAFNLLLPAFPLDGGRLLRASLASRLGLRRATQVAATVGRVLAFALAAFGFLTFQAGGFWLMLIAFFIYAGAGAEERATIVHLLLQDVTVRDMMTPEPGTVAPDDMLDLVHKRMVQERHTAFPVVGAGGLEGCIGLEEMAQARDQEQGRVRVADVMRRHPPVVPPDMPADDVLDRLRRSGHGHLLVTEEDRLVGILSKSDVDRMVRVLDVLRAGSGGKSTGTAS